MAKTPIPASATEQVQDQVEAKDASTLAPAAPTPEPTGHKKAVIVAGGMTVPDGFSVKIVTEARSYTKTDEGLTAEVKKSHYPTGADTYLRTDPEVKFPADAPEVLTLGENVLQHNFWGFTRLKGHVNVGPAHPVFAAANLAYQRGCTVIEIIGLTDAEKEKLKPFFDDLATNAVDPAQVSVSFT